MCLCGRQLFRASPPGRAPSSSGCLLNSPAFVVTTHWKDFPLSLPFPLSLSLPLSFLSLSDTLEASESFFTLTAVIIIRHSPHRGGQPGKVENGEAENGNWDTAPASVRPSVRSELAKATYYYNFSNATRVRLSVRLRCRSQQAIRVKILD